MTEEITYFSESKQKPIAVSTMTDQHVRYAFIKHLRKDESKYNIGYNKGYEDGLKKASEFLDNIGKEKNNVTISNN